MTFVARQSHLATFSRCPLSARFEMEAGERYAEQLDRGTLAHRIVARILTTLRETGQSKMPPLDGQAIMFEVLAHLGEPSEDVLSLPPEGRRHLLKFVARFCEDWEWDAKRILAIEQRLDMPIRCPDGETRILTGQPDVLTRVGTDAIEVTDAKSGFGPPKEPRSDEPKDPRAYLTARGHYQLDAYGLLAMYHYPRAQRVMLREIHPLAPSERQERTAELSRSEMDEVEALIGTDLMLMERALAEGPESEVWKPRPGTKQCAWCVNRKACPKASAQIDTSVILDGEMAVEYAGRIEAVSPYRTELIDQAKAWVDAHGPIPLPDGRVLGWHVPEGKKQRKFEAHFPEAHE
jgi:hypothetical protein